MDILYIIREDGKTFEAETLNQAVALLEGQAGLVKAIGSSLIVVADNLTLPQNVMLIGPLCVSEGNILQMK